MSKQTAKDVVKAIYDKFGVESDRSGLPGEWSALQEFSYSVGGGARRIDVFLVRSWGGGPKGHQRIAIEVKISRSDLLRELAQPHKFAVFKDMSHLAYFAVTEGVVKESDDLGEGVGLLVLQADGTLKQVIRAKKNPMPKSLPEKMFVEAVRRASIAENRIFRADDNDKEAQIVALKKQLKAAKDAERRAKENLARTTGPLNSWVRLLQATQTLPCVCGAPLSKGSERLKWGYMFHADDSYCPNGSPVVDVDAVLKLMSEMTQKGKP